MAPQTPPPLPGFGWCHDRPQAPPAACRWCGQPLWRLAGGARYCDVCDTTRHLAFLFADQPPYPPPGLMPWRYRRPS